MSLATIAITWSKIWSMRSGLSGERQPLRTRSVHQLNETEVPEQVPNGDTSAVEKRS